MRSHKQVLSEIPRWKPTIARLDKSEKPFVLLERSCFEESKVETKIEKPLPVEKVEEISEVSEVCSWTENRAIVGQSNRGPEQSPDRKKVGSMVQGRNQPSHAITIEK